MAADQTLPFNSYKRVYVQSTKRRVRRTRRCEEGEGARTLQRLERRPSHSTLPFHPDESLNEPPVALCAGFAAVALRQSHVALVQGAKTGWVGLGAREEQAVKSFCR